MVDVYVLDGDLLLALASMSVEGFQKCNAGAR
jgi:hypothetical protein